MIDARRVSTGETVEAEVCIIGGGPAGITLATQFVGQDFRVCLLETGGLEPDADIQSMAEGNNEGDAYPGAVYMRNATVWRYGASVEHSGCRTMIPRAIAAFATCP